MKDQKGTSLVSVIVSFAVLMIVLLLLQVSITASGRYGAEAEKVRREAAKAENRYINSDDPANVESGPVASVVLQMQNGEKKERWGYMVIRGTKKESSEESIQIYFVE